MSEELVIEPTVEQIAIKAEEEVGAGFWGEKPQSTIIATEEKIIDEKNEKIIEDKVEPVVTEPFYKKIGFEKEEDVITEITTLKAKLANGYEFKNEESKRVAEYINEDKEDELFQVLDTKRKIKKLSTADLSDKNIAAELVKYGLHTDNPTLNSDEIDFLFSEKYSIPQKPVKLEDEEQEEYDIKVSAWELQKSNIEKRMVIEAKIAQPKMAELNTKIVLPEIKKEIQSTEKQPTQEELEVAKKNVDVFIKTVETELGSLNDFSVTLKDEAVEIPLSYSYSVEEKTKISEQLKSFAESNFDVNSIFAEKWVNKDGKLNVSRMIRDLARLNSEDKIDQKLVQDAGAKRLLEYTKEKKNIQLPGSSNHQNGSVDTAKAVEQVEAAIWSK